MTKFLLNIVFLFWILIPSRSRALCNLVLFYCMLKFVQICINKALGSTCIGCLSAVLFTLIHISASYMDVLLMCFVIDGQSSLCLVDSSVICLQFIAPCLRSPWLFVYCLVNVWCKCLVTHTEHFRCVLLKKKLF